MSIAGTTGKLVMFVGTEAYTWDIGALTRAARNARAMGCDGLTVKRWDGQIKWYGSPERLRLEKQAIESTGLKYIPFGYLYGYRISTEQPAGESVVAKEVLDTCGIACLDMEAEWNSQVQAVHKLVQGLAGHSGTLIVSTWADPFQQDWSEVTKILEPVTQAWGPQQYNNWLAAQRQQLITLGEKVIMPEIDLTSDFGANDPYSIVKQSIIAKDTSVWLWEYQTALKNPNLVRGIASLLGTPHQNVQPVKLPHPLQKKPVQRMTMVEPGDTLYDLAQRLNTQYRSALNWFHDLYLPNRAMLDRSARIHGAPDSKGGNLIYPGTSLSFMTY